MESAVAIRLISGTILYVYDLFTSRRTAATRLGLMKYSINNFSVVIAIIFADLLVRLIDPRAARVGMR